MEPGASESGRGTGRSTSRTTRAAATQAGVAATMPQRGAAAIERITDDASLRVRRHPLGWLGTVFALGLLLGGVTGLFLRRR